jgi:predicted nucleic acid-binding Zn ribbon protein
VGDLVSRLLDRKGLSARVEAASVLTEWPALVGPRIAEVTRAQRVSEGTLFVAVATSAWMMELNLMKAELMRRLNAGRGEGKIRQIVFVMDG